MKARALPVVLLLLSGAALADVAEVAPATEASDVVASPVPAANPAPAAPVASPDAVAVPDLSDPVAPDDPTGVASALDDLIWPFIKTMLMLCLVLALVYLSLNKGLGRLIKRTQAGKRMRVIERVTLDQRRAIFLVEVDGEEILLAAGEGGVTRLDRERPSAPGKSFDLDEVDAGKPPPVTGVRQSGERVRLPVDEDDESKPEEPAA